MKNKKYNKILRGIIATFVFGVFLSAPLDVSAQDIDGNDNNGIVLIENNIITGNVFGYRYFIGEQDENYEDILEACSAKITIKNSNLDYSVDNTICGGYSQNAVNGIWGIGDVIALDNQVIIENLKGNFKEFIGGYAVSSGVPGTGSAYATDNLLSICNSDIEGEGVYGGYAASTGTNSKHVIANNNMVTIDNDNIQKLDADIYGGYIVSNYNGNGSIYAPDNIFDSRIQAEGNTVNITRGKIGNADSDKVVCGSYILGMNDGTTHYSQYNTVELGETTLYGEVYGAYVNATLNTTGAMKDTDFVTYLNDNTVKISHGKIFGNIYGAQAYDQYNDAKKKVIAECIGNNIEIYGDTDIYGSIYGAKSKVKHSNKYGIDSKAIKNRVVIACDNGKIHNNDVTNSIYGGVATVNGKSGDAYSNENIVEITGNTIIEADIYGGYALTESNDKYSGIAYANGNTILVDYSSVNGNVYGGYSKSLTLAKANNNIITLKNNADFSNANIYGSNLANTDTEGNDLIIDGWQGKVNSANNFNNIKFQNLNWQNEGTVLEIGSADVSDLANTNINLISIAGGQNINAGDYMYIIKGNGDLEIDKNLVDNNFSEGIITAGVATKIDGEAFVDDDGTVQYKVNGTSASDQVNLVAENRAVAAAFVNQGTDLINDSLDVLSRDGNYGIKTFAAVHGNRSKYDVNSDLKINGWSSIVGVGNEKNIGNGDFSWGVFYENGSGNYRTYNEFNNEFFRGDGSLVYNGGGIAARFEQDNGVYTEGSLRAGMLKSEMTNALKDGAGNSYGYKSESTYYGAHIGVGKIISLNEATDLDVYGKFFHTYTDGDSFTVANDKFEFDSITSDRLRIGARLTTNKENKFSTYYGLAYEYEFNGDADMRAQNMSAPEQSLKGSSCMAEIGMNYKPSSESPWSFDLSMRGYAGQRDGFSGNVQATYTF